MTLKSILTIDVNDERFKAYKESFDKYQEALAKMPESWKAASAEQDVMMQGFAKVSAALMAHADMSERIARMDHRGAAEADKQAKSWHSIARDTKAAAGNIAAMARSFLKWSGLTGLVGGLLGGGSLWGLTHLAGGVAALRQTAMGLGVTPGQAAAFGIDFGRFVGDPQSMLARVSAALANPTDPAYRGLITSIGNVQGMNAAQASVALLRALPRLFPGGANTPNLGAIAQARGLLDTGLTLFDIRKYLSARPDERRQMERAFASDEQRLNLDRRTTLAYQNLTTQLERAGREIETTFVKGLVSLADPLSKLSQSVVGVVGAFFDAANKKHWITYLADDLDRLSKTIAAGDLLKNVSGFVDDLDKIGKAVHWVASWLPSGATMEKTKFAGVGAVAGGAVGGPIGGVVGGAVGWGLAPVFDAAKDYLLKYDDFMTRKFGPSRSGLAEQTPQAIRLMNDLINKYHWSPEAAAIMAGNVSQESGFNSAAVGDGGQSGGLAQWHNDRFARLVRESGGNWSNWAAQEKLMNEEWRERFGNAVESHDTAYLGQLGKQYEGYSTDTFGARMSAAAVFYRQYQKDHDESLRRIYDRVEKVFPAKASATNAIAAQQHQSSLAYAHKENAHRKVQIEVNKSAGADVNVSVHQMPTWLSSAIAFSPGQ